MKKNSKLLLLLGICLSLSFVHTEKASQKIKTIGKLAKGTGSALINSKSIFLKLTDTLSTIRGDNGLIKSIDTLQKTNTDTLINATNTSTLMGITTGYIIQQAIITILQSLPLNELFNQTGEIGKKISHILTNINDINTLSGDIIGTIISIETPEILRNSTILLERLSERFIKIGTFFNPAQTIVNEAFLNTAKIALHESVNNGIEKAIAFDKNLKKELGITNLSELTELAQENDFSIFQNQGGKIGKFSELIGTMKLLIENSIQKMEEYTQVYPDIATRINTLLNEFKHEENLHKVTHAYTFFTEFSVPLEGIILTSMLMTYEVFLSTSLIIDTFQAINTLFDTSVIQDEVTTELQNIVTDGTLLIKTLHLLSKNFSLQSDQNAIELMYLRKEGQSIIDKLESQKWIINPQEKRLPKGGKQYQGLKKIIGIK